MTLLVLACLLAGFRAGILLLRHAWQNRLELSFARREMIVLAAWILLAVGVAGSTIYAGDRGAAAAITAVMLITLGQFVRNGWRAALAEADNPIPARTVSADLSHINGGPALLRKIAIIVLAGPMAAASAMFITLSVMAFLRAAQYSEANVISLGLALAPLLWAMFAAYAVIDPHLVRKTAAVVLPGIGAAAHLSLST